MWVLRVRCSCPAPAAPHDSNVYAGPLLTCLYRNAFSVYRTHRCRTSTYKYIHMPVYAYQFVHRSPAYVVTVQVQSHAGTTDAHTGFGFEHLNLNAVLRAFLNAFLFAGARHLFQRRGGGVTAALPAVPPAPGVRVGPLHLLQPEHSVGHLPAAELAPSKHPARPALFQCPGDFFGGAPALALCFAVAVALCSDHVQVISGRLHVCVGGGGGGGGGVHVPHNRHALSDTSQLWSPPPTPTLTLDPSYFAAVGLCWGCDGCWFRCCSVSVMRRAYTSLGGMVW